MVEKKTTTPHVTLDAMDPHAPEALRLMARKHRPTNPAKAQELDASADAFAAWRTAWTKGNRA